MPSPTSDYPSFYPGFYSAPGALWPGGAQPGFPGPDRLPITIGYLGNYTLLYPFYRDETTQGDIIAVPGQYYTLTSTETSLAASGGPSLPPADGRWSNSGRSTGLQFHFPTQPEAYARVPEGEHKTLPPQGPGGRRPTPHLAMVGGVLTYRRGGV